MRDAVNWLGRFDCLTIFFRKKIEFIAYAQLMLFIQ